VLVASGNKGISEERNKRLGVQWADLSITDLDRDPELFSEISGLFERFQHISADSHRLIGEYIRSHPGEFVEIEGS
jgi:hypothetical protein